MTVREHKCVYIRTQEGRAEQRVKRAATIPWTLFSEHYSQQRNWEMCWLFHGQKVSLVRAQCRWLINKRGTRRVVTRLQQITNMVPLPVGPTEQQTLGIYFTRTFRQANKHTIKKLKKQSQETTWPKIYGAWSQQVSMAKAHPIPADDSQRIWWTCPKPSLKNPSSMIKTWQPSQHPLPSVLHTSDPGHIIWTCTC